MCGLRLTVPNPDRRIIRSTSFLAADHDRPRPERQEMTILPTAKAPESVIRLLALR